MSTELGGVSCQPFDRVSLWPRRQTVYVLTLARSQLAFSRRVFISLFDQRSGAHNGESKPQVRQCDCRAYENKTVPVTTEQVKETTSQQPVRVMLHNINHTRTGIAYDTVHLACKRFKKKLCCLNWNFPHGKIGSPSPRKASCDGIALPNLNKLLAQCMLYFGVTIPLAVRPTLIGQMVMGSLTCAQIWVHAVHTKGDQKQISLHKS